MAAQFTRSKLPDPPDDPEKKTPDKKRENAHEDTDASTPASHDEPPSRKDSSSGATGNSEEASFSAVTPGTPDQPVQYITG